MNQSLDQTQKNPSSSTSQNKPLDIDFLKETLNKVEALEVNLQERARELAEKDLELKIVDEKLSVKSNQLKTLNESVDKSQRKLDEVDRLIKYHGELKHKLIEDLQRIRKDFKQTLTSNKQKLDAQKFELTTQLKEIEIDIKTRAEFFAQQEFDRQEVIKALTEKASGLENDISILESTEKNLSLSCSNYRESFKELTDEVKTKSKELQALGEKQKDLESTAKKEKHLQELEEKAKVAEYKINQLRIKEESLIAREEALVRKAQEVQLRERRLTGKERLYQV